jgi:hypothetical protein
LVHDRSQRLEQRRLGGLAGFNALQLRAEFGQPGEAFLAGQVALIGDVIRLAREVVNYFHRAAYVSAAGWEPENFRSGRQP